MFEKNIKNNKKGTTLLELLVALALFSTAMLMATQIFNMVMKAQRTAVVSQNIESDMRYLTEVITKEMRMAEVDKDGDCVTQDRVYEVIDTGSGDTLSFLNSDDECVEYEVNNKKFEISRTSDGGGGDTETKVVTSEDALIKDIDFNQYGEVPASQPQITMNLDIALAPKAGTERRNIKLQTTISTRHYE